MYRNVPFCLEQNVEVNDPNQRIENLRRYLTANLFLIDRHEFKTDVYRDRLARNKSGAGTVIREVLGDVTLLDRLIN